MKKEIHPKYDKAVIKCACGNVIETKSTVPGEMRVELCSACHPFYTGKQKFIDTAGRVDKFKARIEAAKKSQNAKGKGQNSNPKVKSEVADNKEKLTAIKEELNSKKEPKTTKAPKSAKATLGVPGEVSQSVTSEEENAADSELNANNEPAVDSKPIESVESIAAEEITDASGEHKTETPIDKK